jgi:hypothetical protein
MAMSSGQPMTEVGPICDRGHEELARCLSSTLSGLSPTSAFGYQNRKSVEPIFFRHPSLGVAALLHLTDYQQHNNGAEQYASQHGD